MTSKRGPGGRRLWTWNPSRPDGPGLRRRTLARIRTAWTRVRIAGAFAWDAWLVMAPRVRAPALLFAGWAAVTAGLAEVGWFNPLVVWPVSAGLLAWGLYGFRRLWLTVVIGIEPAEDIDVGRGPTE